MSLDGSHLVCEKCQGRTSYCSINKEWICLKCELDEVEVNKYQ